MVMPFRIDSSSEILGRRPFRPLFAFMLLSFGAVAIQPGGSDWNLVGSAALVASCLTLVAGLAPWSRLPDWVLIVPALGTFVVVAILRQSEGGAASGYGSLAFLPVVWVALVLGRRAVVVAALAGTAMFTVPIVAYGAPMYPSSSWRSAILWTVVASAVGLVVTSVVARQRRQATSAREHAVTVADTLRALEAVADVARDISSGVDARERVCAAAVSSANATLVTIVEERNGAFALTGAAGIAPELVDLVQPKASLSAYFSQQRVFIPDVTTNPNISQVIVAATGMVSVLFEPIIRHGRSVGVLGVGWATKRESVDARTQAVIAYLAAEAGSAIERSDLLAQLDGQARTDELTSIPNRRSWDNAIAKAVDGSGPVCVAMIDIDHFKAFNDEHGHLEGDHLLQRCADAWQAQIRPGDMIARYGGEEFAMLLHDCTLADATAVLDRVRRATPTAVTCSLGVAERRFTDTADTLVARADAALYRAKREGRDRLELAA
jgi:diguanylate cyclase (GGDEF)-like protein